MTVSAASAQEALDGWLNTGDEVVTAFAVEERHVEDERGQICETEDA